MTSGIRTEVFDSTSVVPGDYRLLVTARPVMLEPGVPQTVAFGLVIGHSLEALQENVDVMLEVFESTPLAVEEDELAEIPEAVSILQNFPNPFSDVTTIEFELEVAGRVRLSIFDVLGQEVAELTSGHFSSGIHQVTWHASGVPDGVYFYRLESDRQSSTGTMFVVR
jgi:hypothetical protein